MEKILTEKEVCELLKISRATLWRWQRDGKFPKRRSFGPKSPRWLYSEIDRWVKLPPGAFHEGV